MNQKDTLAQAYQLFQQGQFASAWRLLQPLAQAAADVSVLHLAGAAAAASGAHAEAIGLLRRALAVAPGELAISYKLGRILVDAGQPQEALSLYLQLIHDGVQHPDVYTAAAVLLRECGHDEEALQSLQRALQLAPQAANNWYLQSVLQARLGRLPAALESLQRAIALAPEQIHFHRDLALALHGLHRNAQALEVIEHTLAMEPQAAVIWNARAAILSRLGRYQEAIASSEQALALQPGDADASVNLALTLMTLGQLERAWPWYEARWQGELADPLRHQQIARWSVGATLRGKTILLWAEQGFGDTIQFCRYVLQVIALGARVVLEVPPQLSRLLATLGSLADGLQVIEPGALLPALDYQLPLMSLPLMLGTRLDNIPAYPAYLYSDPRQSADWAEVLGPRQRWRIGIVCAGNGGNRRDASRSIPLALFAPLCGQIDADFYLLQPALRQTDHAALQEIPGLRWPGQQLRGFDDTAALIAHLDLVISVDTAVAHLAGALGVPVWILLSQAVDWRWFLQRSDSPWYPSARLWRQSHSGDWQPVLQAVQQALLQAQADGAALLAPTAGDACRIAADRQPPNPGEPA